MPDDPRLRVFGARIAEERTHSLRRREDPSSVFDDAHPEDLIHDEVADLARELVRRLHLADRWLDRV